VAKEEDSNATPGPSIGKGCEAIQDPTTEQELRETIQKASRRGENAITVPLLQVLDHRFPVLCENSPVLFLVCHA
jgi:hypothetical protein